MPALKDCVHSWIVFTELEKKLIDSRIFQRLRHIRQTTTCNLVYPDSCHTRFSHSIGTMHIATRYVESLEIDNVYTDKWRKTVRMAALLHDIAHGPFSHAYDHFVYNEIYNSEKGHDEHRKSLIRQNPLRDLVVACDIDPEDVINIWNGSDKVGNAILSGPLGADRFDFLLRDSHMCGTKEFGEVGYDRIIYNVSAIDGCLVYPTKVSAEIQNFISSRIWMYENVYLHKTSLAGEYLLEKIFEFVKEPLNLVERTKNIDEFIKMTDSSLIEEARNISAATQYVDRYLYRELPKVTEIQNSDEAHTITLELETLDKSKFQNNNIKIQDDFGVIHDAYEWLRDNGIIKDKIYRKMIHIEEV